jgi:hypothetical protein
MCANECASECVFPMYIQCVPMYVDVCIQCVPMYVDVCQCICRCERCNQSLNILQCAQSVKDVCAKEFSVDYTEVT